MNSSEVEYLIVGALAVSWHGFARYSADIDVLIRPSPANAARVVEAIRRFGMGGVGLTAADFSAPGKVVQLGVEPVRIDILTSLTGVSFDEAWESRSPGALDGIPVAFIGRQALIRNKEATGRPKDRIDAIELRSMAPPE